MVHDPTLDGVTHINVYSKGKTKLGKFLSNFTHTPIETEDGHFESVEGYWHWLGLRDDKLRTLYGWEAKKYASNSVKTFKLTEEEFKNKIRKAITIKLETNPDKLSELRNTVLPLAHYYVFNGFAKDAGYKWILEHINSFRIERKAPMIYTAQYRYSGQDRIDITVKGNHIVGKLYAPTWDMIMGLKNGKIIEDQYTQMYYKMLCDRWENKDYRETTLSLVDMVTTGSQSVGHPRGITFVCFCPAENFCHRYLLVKWFQHNWNVPYGGERSL